MNATSFSFDDDLPFLPPSHQQAGAGPSIFSVTATHLLSSVLHQAPFKSGSDDLDRLLGGGVSRGQTFEIAGPPSAGKTKLAVGLAVRAIRDSLAPSAKEEAEALFIDTEGSADRLLFHNSATALCSGSASGTTIVNQVCERIHLVRICSTASLAMFLRQLPEWLQDHPRVRLVIVDTMSALLRPVSLEKSERAHVVSLAKRAFMMATSVHNCAVLVTSQMSTKLFSSTTGAPADFQSGDLAFLSTPGLGLGEQGGWMTRDTRRVSLFFTSAGERRAMMIAGPQNVGESASFAVDNVGAADIARQGMQHGTTQANGLPP